MKKVVALLVCLGLICCSALADTRTELLEHVAYVLNECGAEMIESCKYDAASDSLLLVMTLGITMDEFEMISQSYKDDVREMYVQGHSIMTDSMNSVGISANTVSVAKTSDNVPFFICVNGIDQSWMFDE